MEGNSLGNKTTQHEDNKVQDDEPAMYEECSAVPLQPSIKSCAFSEIPSTCKMESTDLQGQGNKVIAKGEQEQATSPVTITRCDMLASSSQSTTKDEMVFFRRSEFTRQQESSSFHVSALPSESKDAKTWGHKNKHGDLRSRTSDNGSCLKRTHNGGSDYGVENKKKMRFDGVRTHHEEISQSDFEMALIKSCLARKKNWIYNELSQKFGILPPVEEKMERNIQGENVLRNGSNNELITTHGIGTMNATHALSTSVSQQQNTTFLNNMLSRPYSVPANTQRFTTIGVGKKGTYLKEFPGDSKVFDDEGNCYIDSHDFDSFYTPKKEDKAAQVVPRMDFDAARTYTTKSTFVNPPVNSRYHKDSIPLPDISTDVAGNQPTRGLNFTFHGTNGGFAVDHDSMPRIIAIHSIPIQGRSLTRRQHVVAEKSGSHYKPAPETTTARDAKTESDEPVACKKTAQAVNWWPPSPDSMPEDVMHQEHGGGLLKIMTHEDRAACGLANQEATSCKQEPVDDDDDVIVTKVTPPKRRHENGSTHTSPNATNEQLQNLYRQQYSSDTTGNNFENKEFILHLLALRAQQQEKISAKKNNKAEPRQKLTMKELCEKLSTTRKRMENEQLRWKRKLLLSLEAVLIKKIRRFESNTGESIPEGLVLEGSRAQRRDQQRPLGGGEGMDDSTNNLVTMVGELTAESDEESAVAMNCGNRKKRNSVSEIRGYDST